MTGVTDRVVVGVDDGEDRLAAVDAAADEATPCVRSSSCRGIGLCGEARVDGRGR
jgi:hypothetical protein